MLTGNELGDTFGCSGIDHLAATVPQNSPFFSPESDRMRDVLPIVIGAVVIVLGLLAMQVVRVFDRDPERGMRLFGAIGMLFHSFFKARRRAGKHHHRRRSDPPTAPEHEHVRRPTPHPTGFMTIRAFASPPPQRRRESDDPTPPETPETL